jgi:type IV pilus assembly protein PilN
MIKINLLPFRAARRKENVRRQISIFFLSIIVVTVGLFYYNISLGAKVTSLTNKVNSTRTAYLAKKKQADEVDRIQKQLNILKQKTEVIINLAMSRKEPVFLLDTMTKMVVEKRMWFTSFTENGMSLNIRGIALDNKTVADFMTRLEAAAIFTDVRLQSTKKQKIGEYDNLKSFVVTLNKIPLSELVKQAKEKKKAEKS